MFAVGPVKSFFGHAQGNDQIHVIFVFHLAQISGDSFAIAGSIVDQIGYFKQLTVGVSSYVNNARFGVHVANVTDGVQYRVNFAVFVFGGLPRIDVRNVQNGLFVGIQYFQNRRDVFSLIKMVPDAQRFQVGIAVELLVIVVGDLRKFSFVFGIEHGYAVAPEIRSRHGHHVRVGMGHDAPQQFPQTAVAVGGDVVKLVNGQQRVVEGRFFHFFKGKPQRSMGTDQDFFVIDQKVFKRLYLAFAAVEPRRT